MDHDDLERQVAFIEGSMYAHLARETKGRAAADDRGRRIADSSVEPSSEAFVASALTLAEAIRSRAIHARTEACRGSRRSSWSRRAATSCSR